MLLFPCDYVQLVLTWSVTDCWALHHCCVQAPLVLWAIAVIIICSLSFTRVQNLQGPLASLDVAAHVVYRLSKVNTYTINLAFNFDDSLSNRYKAQLIDELDLLEKEYNTLLYGGISTVQVRTGRLTAVRPHVMPVSIKHPSLSF